MAQNYDGFGNADVDDDDYSFSGAGKSAKDVQGSDLVDRPGFYHMELTGVVPDFSGVNRRGQERTKHVRFDFTVVHSVNGQSPQGSRYFHKHWVGTKNPEWEQDAALKLAMGLGVAKEVKNPDGTAEIVDSETGSTAMTLATFKRAVGNQAIVKLVLEKDNDGKERITCPYTSVYRPDDPRVRDVPKDIDALEGAGIFVGSEDAPLSSAPDADDDLPDFPDT